MLTTQPHQSAKVKNEYELYLLCPLAPEWYSGTALLLLYALTLDNIIRENFKRVNLGYQRKDRK
jgi:hypothetical protein